MKKRKSTAIKIVCAIILSSIVITISAITAIMVFGAFAVDSQADERLFELAREGNENTYYTDASYFCRELEEYEPEFLCRRSYSEYDKSWYSISDISQNLKKAYICTEDRRFYDHHGVDLKRTVYAFANSVFRTKRRFGGSTITQQVIKNISGDNEITVKRKLTEIIRALRLERKHSKDEIFEVYMNIVPMGEGAVGIGSGSRVYFGKSPEDLTLSEAATLVAISNAPTRYNPHTAPVACKEKRDIILRSMYDSGKITEDEYLTSVSMDLSVIPMAKEAEKVDSWFIETVNSDVIAALREKYDISDSAARALFSSGGFSIYTTENRKVQSVLEEYFSDTSNLPPEVALGLDFAMVICDSQNGTLSGIIGSAGKKTGNRLLNQALVPHTPGSALKPIALYAPLINLRKINAATVFDDVPVNFLTSKGGIVEYPKNYPNVYSGLTTVSDALRASKNTVAVRLYGLLGAEKIYSSLVNDFGFDTVIRKDFGNDGSTLTDLAVSPLALGQLSYGVTLRRLTEAYTVFPSEGTLTKGRSFVAVYDSSGNLVLDNRAENKNVYRKEAARIMNTLLQNVVESGTASSITLKGAVDTAGKTGTSGDDKDRLFVGYTPYLTAGIWCGYQNGTRAVSTIYPTHLKIWDSIMTKIHSEMLNGVSDEQIKSFSTEGLVKRGYCKDSGRLFCKDCMLDPRGTREAYGYFEITNQPLGACDRHVACYYDTETEAIATNRCPRENLKKIALIRVEDRAFPKEITVSDAEYVYRRVDRGMELPEDYTVPYFKNSLADGVYVGIGRRKKQYNSVCYLHDD